MTSQVFVRAKAGISTRMEGIAKTATTGVPQAFEAKRPPVTSTWPQTQNHPVVQAMRIIASGNSSRTSQWLLGAVASWH